MKMRGHGLVKAQRHNLCELCALANSPMAVAMSAVVSEYTQLGDCSGFDLALRRGAQRASDIGSIGSALDVVGYKFQALQHLFNDSRTC